MREENRLNPFSQTHEELPAGTAVGLTISDEQILLCNVDGLHYAIANVCPHGKSLLSEGKLRGHVITCPLHGARFDVRTGKCLGGPATEGVRSYAVDRDSAGLIVSTS